MFEGCVYINSVKFNQDAFQKCTTALGMFSECLSLTQVDINTGNIPDLRSMFYKCTSLSEVPNIEITKNTKDIRSIFSCCTSLTNVDLSKYDLTNIEDCSSMFKGCTNLIKVDFGKQTFSGFDSTFDFIAFNNDNKKLREIDLSEVDLPVSYADGDKYINIGISSCKSMKKILLSDKVNIEFPGHYSSGLQ